MEVAGFVVGVTALAGLFNNAVDSFEYIQLARSFNQDFQTSQLKLRGTQLQLSRWGVSVGLGPDHETAEESGDEDERIPSATEYLEQIHDLIGVAKRISERHSARGKEIEVRDAREMEGAAKKLSQAMSKLSLGRRGNLGVGHKTRWALTDKSRLDRLVADIGDLVEKLVELFPAAKPEQTRLCDGEVQTLKDPEGLPLLREAVLPTDEALKAAIERVVGPAGGTTSNVAYITGDNNQGFQIGQNLGSINSSRGGSK